MSTYLAGVATGIAICVAFKYRVNLVALYHKLFDRKPQQA